MTYRILFEKDIAAGGRTHSFQSMADNLACGIVFVSSGDYFFKGKVVGSSAASYPPYLSQYVKRPPEQRDLDCLRLAGWFVAVVDPSDTAFAHGPFYLGADQQLVETRANERANCDVCCKSELIVALLDRPEQAMRILSGMLEQ